MDDYQLLGVAVLRDAAKAAETANSNRELLELRGFAESQLCRLWCSVAGIDVEVYRRHLLGLLDGDRRGQHRGGRPALSPAA